MAKQSNFQPKCPTCDMLADTSPKNKYLPFCSERCRLIDLGRWLNEEHALPCEAEDETAEQESSSAPRLPPGWHDA